MKPQIAAVFLDATVAQLELPASEEEVMPGVLWGTVDAFPTPAYWLYQGDRMGETGRFEHDAACGRRAQSREPS